MVKETLLERVIIAIMFIAFLVAAALVPDIM